jgi:putative FmdB family regulatory protein
MKRGFIMPTYDYQCQKCQNIQEVFHPISENPRVACVKCQSKCKRIVTQVNFILKGGGWPSQDIKSKSEMLKKNSRMKTKMNDQEQSGEAVRNLGELRKKKNNS